MNKFLIEEYRERAVTEKNARFLKVYEMCIHQIAEKTFFNIPYYVIVNKNIQKRTYEYINSLSFPNLMSYIITSLLND